MEAQVQRLVDKTWEKYLQLPEGRRLSRSRTLMILSSSLLTGLIVIGIAGIPGSGKKLLARIKTAQ